MKYEALYTSVLGAGPAILIAFVLEHRGIYRKKKHRTPASVFLYRAGVFPTTLGLIVSVLELSPLRVSTPKGEENVAQFVTLMMLVGIASLLATLVATEPKPRDS